MSLFKKVTAIVTSLAMTAGLSACTIGESSSWIAKYDENQVRAGIYIYYMMNSYYEGIELAQEQDENLDTEDLKAIESVILDGKMFSEWVEDKATEYVQKYIAVEMEFEALGLSLTDDETAEIESSLETYWGYYGDFYAENGIGEESFEDIIALSYKSSAVFSAYYSEGGSFEVPEDDMLSYYDENYARVKYIKLSLTDGDGNEIDKDTVKSMAQDYLERIEKGESIDDLLTEYNEYYTALTAEEDEETSEEETTAVVTEAETTAVTEEETVSETEVSEAETEVEAAEAANSEETTVAEEDEEPSEETTAAEEDEEPSEETTAAEEDEEPSEETTAAEEDEEPSEETTVAEEDEELSEEIAVAEEDDEETTDPYPNESTIKKSDEDTATPSAEVNKEIFSHDDDETPFIASDDSAYYVIQRFDILDAGRIEALWTDDVKMTILQDMKADDYDEKLLEIASLDVITTNDKAYSRYYIFDMPFVNE